MKRRQALRHLGLGISTSLVGASWFVGCKKDDPGPQVRYDGTVVIIGAGPAGLYAADILNTKGINVVVLEATKQPGGRVLSLRNQEDLPYQSIADYPVELGAEFFQGNDSIWGKIIGNLGLATVDLTTAVDQYIIDAIVKDAVGWQGDPDFNAAQNFVANIRNFAGAGGSVREAAAGISARGQNLINSQAGNFYGSSSERIGMKGLSDQLKLVTHDKKFYLLRNNPMQDAVISRFAEVISKVQLNSPVQSISYGSDPIQITLEDGSKIEANKVIVTVPVPILKEGISFSPELAATKTSALNKIGMDPSMRVILDFKKNFWGENSGFLWGGSTVPQYFNAGTGRSEFFSTMSITINGPKATELADIGSDQGIVDRILEELDELYEGQGTSVIRKTIPTMEEPEEKMIYFIKDWTKEKYVGGGYAFPLVSTTFSDLEALAAPIDGKLFFAGEATDLNGEIGTVNGALSSAERVADDVVKSILEVS